MAAHHARIVLGLMVMGAFSLSATRPPEVNEQKQVDAKGREYFVYAPDKVDPNKTYWMVAGIHAYLANGQGAGGMASWAKKYDCFVIGPTFPNGYQGLMYESDDQLIGLHAELSKSVKLHEKMFVAGFSGGAQFAHRFALKHPDLVIGCAAHSAGSWATGDLPGDLRVTPAVADSVPMVFSCGMMDTAKSMPDSPFTRIDWAHQFEKQLLAAHAYYKFGYWPNVGHGASPGSTSLTDELFRLSITGLHAPQLMEVGRLIDPIEAMIRSGNLEKAKTKITTLPTDFAALRKKWDTSKLPTGAAAGWHENPQMITELAKRADAFIAEKVTEFTARVTPQGKAPAPSR